jgi:carbamoyltransferase
MSSLFGIYGGPTSHDAGAVFVRDGKILSAIQEERPKRIKVCNDLDALPDLSIQRIEEEFNIKLNQVDWVCTATPVSALSEFWNVKHKIPKEKIYLVNHHDAHCYGAYYTSGFNEPTIVLSYDGGGLGHLYGFESSYGKLYLAENNEMNHLQTMGFSTSATIPCMYAFTTRWLGWRIHKDEGKVTGLAGHGKYDDKIYKALEHLCQYDSHSMTFTPAGVATSDFGISLVFDYLEDIKRIPSKYTRDDDEKAANLAYNVQLFLENKMVEYLNDIHKKYPEFTKVTAAGGVFSNVKLNQRLNEIDWVDEMYVYPAMTDAGLALGASLKKAVELGEWKTQRFQDVFLGTGYTQTEIDKIIGWKNES